jgi:DNA repair exonuclease SbcCD ATPase subunit
MIFVSVEMQNFLRFKEAMVPLKDQGLVLVKGINHDSTAADSNGSGKSSIFEAIVWCLWGKTVRGYSGDKVINRTVGKDCVVQLVIEHEGEKFTVERYRKHHQYKNELHFHHITPSGPTDLSEGTTTLTQKLIDEWLGIDFNTYIRGPMVGQGNFKRFSQMTDSEQKTVLETALQVSILSDARDTAKSKLNALHLKLQQGDAALTMAKEQRSYLQEKLAKSGEEYREAWRKYQGLMKGMYTHVVGAVLRVESAERELEELPEIDVDEANARWQKFSQMKDQWISTADAEEAKLRSKLQTCIGDLQVAKGELKAAKSDLEAFKSTITVGQPCPTCMQVTEKEHHDACMQALVGKISEYEAAVTLEQEAYDEAEQAVATMAESHRSQLQAIVKVMEQAQEQYQEACRIEERRRYWHNDIEEAERLREQELQRFQSWAKSSVPKNPADELQQELANLKERIEVLVVVYSEVEVEAQYLQFWNKGFGNSGLKSLIFDSIVPFLNDRARLYARDLTAGEVKIEFSTKTKLKGGEIREKFNVITENVNGADDYDGSSGGEQGRIDLGINFSLSDLMAARAKKSFPQRFFDEPFEGVDEAGQEAVMELLSNMVQNCGTIFVVTHKPAMASLFDRVITVHKKNGVSVIEA